jgi:hypothetical protein
MFDKKDPLIGAVQQVMQKNAEERAKIAAVNERFGVQTKRQLPHERHAEYDRAIAEAKSGAPSVIKEEATPQKETPKVKAAKKADDKAHKMVKSVFKKAFKGAKEKEYWEESKAPKEYGVDGERSRAAKGERFDNKGKIVKKSKVPKEYGVDGERSRAAKGERIDEAQPLQELSTEKLLKYRKAAKAASDKVPNPTPKGTPKSVVHKAIKHDVYRGAADEKIKKKTGKYNPNIIDRIKARLKGK